MKKVLVGAASILIAVGSVNAANIASGKLWHVDEATSQNAIPANIPLATPDVTFDVNSPFNFSGTSVSVGDWLASSSAFNINELTSGTLASLMDGGVPQMGTLVEFTGNVSVVNGQHFSVTHDDGLTLIIGGLDLGFSPGPTSPVATDIVYTGPSGNFPFQLVYGECCGGPAVLAVNLPFTSNAPDTGSSLLLLGSGCGALMMLGRIRKAQRA